MADVVFTPKSKKDLDKLPKSIQQRVIRKLTFFAEQSNPLVYAKPLIHVPPSTHRFRVGSYRIAFTIDDDTIYVHRIRHRKDVYGI